MSYKSLVVAILVIFVIWLTSGFILYNWSELGVLGDRFGSINTLFSGLAFAGVIYAIILQRKELELQRKELVLTRNELQGQKIQMENQNKTLKLQNFERTFFELLKLHLDIVNLMRIHNHEGRDCFEFLYNQLRAHYEARLKDTANVSDVHRLKVSFSGFYVTYRQLVAHYFGNVLNMLAIIDDSDIEGKERYIRFLESLLSNNEITMLFYYHLSRLPEGILMRPEHASFYNQ
jgi:hypothetical protein